MNTCDIWNLQYCSKLTLCGASDKTLIESHLNTALQNPRRAMSFIKRLIVLITLCDLVERQKGRTKATAHTSQTKHQGLGDLNSTLALLVVLRCLINTRNLDYACIVIGLFHHYFGKWRVVTSVKFDLINEEFLSRKCIWKCKKFWLAGLCADAGKHGWMHPV